MNIKKNDQIITLMGMFGIVTGSYDYNGLHVQGYYPTWSHKDHSFNIGIEDILQVFRFESPKKQLTFDF